MMTNKPGRKAIVFTDEMMERVKRLWVGGFQMTEIAESVGVGVATLYRKIAANKSFQEELKSKSRLRKTPYRKLDTEYWDKLTTQGAANKKLIRAIQWKKFELMKKNNISYREALKQISILLD